MHLHISAEATLDVFILEMSECNSNEGVEETVTLRKHAYSNI